MTHDWAGLGKGRKHPFLSISSAQIPFHLIHFIRKKGHLRDQVDDLIFITFTVQKVKSQQTLIRAAIFVALTFPDYLKDILRQQQLINSLLRAGESVTRDEPD